MCGARSLSPLWPCAIVQVYHYWYRTWPDHGVPTAADGSINPEGTFELGYPHCTMCTLSKAREPWALQCYAVTHPGFVKGKVLLLIIKRGPSAYSIIRVGLFRSYLTLIERHVWGLGRVRLGQVLSELG